MNKETEKLYEIPYSEVYYGVITISAKSKEQALEMLENGDYDICEPIKSDSFDYFAGDITELG